MAKKKSTKKRRAVVVAGCRTPFVRAFGEFMKIDTIDLGDRAVERPARAHRVARKEIDGVVWGGVILPGTAPERRAARLRWTCGCPAVGRGDDGHPRVRRRVFRRSRCAGGGHRARRGRRHDRGRRGLDEQREINLPQKLVHALAPLAFGKADAKAAARRARAAHADQRDPAARARKSPSAPPGRSWARPPRRWPRRNESSRAKPRTRSPCARTTGRRRPSRAGASTTRSCPCRPPERQAGPRRRHRPRRHHRGEAAQAASGVRQGRHAHGRQLERRSPTAPPRCC